MAAFFFVIPLIGAVVLVMALAPDDSYVPTSVLGSIRVWFRDQRVPTGIGLFTLIEIALWQMRERLPWSHLLTTPGRADVPQELHGDFERAAGLLEEADKIKKARASDITADLSADERKDLDTKLDELRAAMRAEPFDADRFSRAFDQADSAVDLRLDPYRKGELREYAESIGIAVAVALLLRGFFVEAFKIPSGSMIPTLQVGDHIFVNKLSYGPLIPWTKTRLFNALPPRRGDVIVFIYPENPEQDFIKRVVTVPGDKLEVRDGHPIINGLRVPFCHAGTYAYRESEGAMQRRADLTVEYLEDKAFLVLHERHSYSYSETQGPYTTKPGEVWVMGDNRNNSHDSRGWFEGRGGGVPFANIKGKALFVWLSFNGSKLAFDRLLVNVMGQPKLPPELVSSLGPGVEKCLRERPPLSETTPPAPTP